MLSLVLNKVPYAQSPKDLCWMLKSVVKLEKKIKSYKDIQYKEKNKKLSYHWQTARRVYGSVKVTKHGTISHVMDDFLLLSYSNFVRFWDTRLENAVTLKTALRSVKVNENVTIR